MRWEEYVGFAAFGANVAGNWLLTSKKTSGWWIRIVSNVAQLAYGMLVASPYLIVNAVTFGVINVVGIVKWRKEAK